MADESKTLWCGNLSDKVTEELLYELFLQVAPLERVRIPSDKEGRKSNYAFITVKHEASVDYVVQLLNGTALYDRNITLKPRGSNHNQAAQTNQSKNLLLMDQIMQLAYNNGPQMNNCIGNRRSGGNERFNRDDYKPYNKHHNNNRHDNFGSSGQQGRNSYQWNNHRNYDRSRRRYY